MTNRTNNTAKKTTTAPARRTSDDTIGVVRSNGLGARAYYAMKSYARTVRDVPASAMAVYGD